MKKQKPITSRKAQKPRKKTAKPRRKKRELGETNIPGVGQIDHNTGLDSKGVRWSCYDKPVSHHVDWCDKDGWRVTSVCYYEDGFYILLRRYQTTLTYIRDGAAEVHKDIWTNEEISPKERREMLLAAVAGEDIHDDPEVITEKGKHLSGAEVISPEFRRTRALVAECEKHKDLPLSFPADEEELEAWRAERSNNEGEGMMIIRQLRPAKKGEKNPPIGVRATTPGEYAMLKAAGRVEQAA